MKIKCREVGTAKVHRMNTPVVTIDNSRRDLSRTVALLAMPLADLRDALDARTDGLSAGQVSKRRKQFGANESAPHAGPGAAAQLIARFRSPLVIVLLVSAVVSGFVGDAIGASIIVAIVLMSAALNFVVTFRLQRAAARLREEVAPMATVYRDHAWSEIARRDLVPGDLIASMRRVYESQSGIN